LSFQRLLIIKKMNIHALTPITHLYSPPHR
jgi:hypothetical protein